MTKPRGPALSSLAANSQVGGYPRYIPAMSFSTRSSTERTVLCKDPFRSVDERVEKLIAGM